MKPRSKAVCAEADNNAHLAKGSQLQQRRLRQLVAGSVLTGLCPLIPLPLLDDFARDLLRKRLVTRLAAAAGTTLTDADAKILACGYRPPPAAGCAHGCLRVALVKPVVFLSALIFHKIVRKLLFFLTVKDAIGTFSQTFHEAYLLDHAMTLGALREPAALTPPQVDPRLRAIRAAVEAVVKTTDTGPVTHLARSVFAGSRRLAVHSARRMTHVLRRRRRAGEDQLSERLEREGEAGLGGLIDTLTVDLESQGGYLKQMEAALEQRLAIT